MFIGIYQTIPNHKRNIIHGKFDSSTPQFRCKFNENSFFFFSKNRSSLIHSTGIYTDVTF